MHKWLYWHKHFNYSYKDNIGHLHALNRFQYKLRCILESPKPPPPKTELINNSIVLGKTMIIEFSIDHQYYHVDTQDLIRHTH